MIFIFYRRVSIWHLDAKIFDLLGYIFKYLVEFFSDALLSEHY